MQFGFIRDVWILQSFLFALVLLLIFIILLLEFRYKYERIFEKKLDTNTNMLFHYGGFIIILMTLFTYIEARGIKEGTFIVKDYKIEMINGDLISTTKDLIYIGQTKSFLFVYDRSNDETSIINKQQIKKISIKKRKQTTPARTSVPPAGASVTLVNTNKSNYKFAIGTSVTLALAEKIYDKK